MGCCCAMCGVLVIALPVSVVGTNFSLFYTYAKARLNLPPKAEQKLPLSKQLTSLKAKTDLPHPSSSYSCNSIAKKYEQTKGSLEGLTPNQNDEKPGDVSSHRSSTSERRPNGSTSKHPDSPSSPTTDENLDLTPSFRECNFDFLEVPDRKRLKRSFLTNSFSRMLGAITHHHRHPHVPENRLQLELPTTYPLYLRRGAVAPGSISSRSFSSTIYDSSSSNLPNCVKQSVRSLRRRQKLSRSGRLRSRRKCTSNAELHLVCFHRCEKHPNIEKNVDATKTDCSCPTHGYNKPRLAKSCSELNDILQGNYRTSFNSMNSDNFLSSGEDVYRNDATSNSAPLSQIAITINGCSDDGSDSKDQKAPLLRINNPGTKGTFLKPWANNHQGT